MTFLSFIGLCILLMFAAGFGLVFTACFMIAKAIDRLAKESK
jgi:hypothetical protein